MASRRRPPPRSGPAKPAAPGQASIESLEDPPERTVISEMPVFDDEAPTPVPEVSAPPTPRPPPTGAKLGAAPVPAAPEVRREATFVGLPVGLGAEPAEEPLGLPTGSTPEPPSTSRPPTDRGAVTRARAPSASPSRGRPSEVSVQPAPASPAASTGLSLPTPGAPSRSSGEGLRLPRPGAPATPASAPAPARGGEAPAVEAPSPRVALPLGFDAPDPAEAKPVAVPLYAEARPSGSGRWAGVAVAAAVLGVVALFAGGEEPSVDEAGGAEASQGPRARTQAAYTPPPRSIEAPTRPSSAVARARAAGRAAPRGASIARRRAAKPGWSPERLAALSGGASPPALGGEAQPRQTYGRPYLEDEGAPPQPPMLMIFTAPPGMTIELEGKLYGRTPLVRPVYGAVDKLRVRLRGAGYEPKSVVIEPGKDGQFRFNGVMTPVE